MSYTDDTVYQLRDIIDSYTDIALEHRTEKEKQKLLSKHMKQNGLNPADVLKSIQVQKKEESKDMVIVLMEECIYEYKDKKRSLDKIKEENRAIEQCLEANNISYSDLFIDFPPTNQSP